jgi:hypothetical protein
LVSVFHCLFNKISGWRRVLIDISGENVCFSVLFWGSWTIPVFYSVIETRDFSLFNQSAQALLKGYFIMLNNKASIDNGSWLFIQFQK